MSTSHGETAMQKPIIEYAAYLKRLIPVNIPDAYALKPMFQDVSGEYNIRNGVVAFRDFLYVFCDRLISDGHLYAKPQKTKNPLDYPFMKNMNQLVIEVSMKYGYCIVVRSKKTDKYADLIETFSLFLREKIAAGYGCDRKLRNEPCQGGCQGIRIAMDDSTIAMKRDIELWLDHENSGNMTWNTKFKP